MLNMDLGTRRLVAAGAIACALAAGAYTTLRVTFGGRPVYIHVRWVPRWTTPYASVSNKRWA